MKYVDRVCYTLAELEIVIQALKDFIEKRKWSGIGTNMAVRLHDRAEASVETFWNDSIRRIEIDGKKVFLIKKGGRTDAKN